MLTLRVQQEIMYYYLLTPFVSVQLFKIHYMHDHGNTLKGKILTALSSAENKAETVIFFFLSSFFY